MMDKQVSRSGFALILVLIVVAMLALSTYTFCSLMVTENESAVLAGRQLQARVLIDSGADHVRYFLELDPLAREGLGGTYDNPQLFQAQLVTTGLTPRTRGRFGVVAPRLDPQGYLGGLRFGLQDESCRLNLNAIDLSESVDVSAVGADDAEPDATDEEEDSSDEPIDMSGRGMLMNLPGMTLEVADAILDWIDSDDDPREYGAEIDYYSSLSPGYAPQNGPFKTIEELLLVRDVTPELLFGRDINRNGMLDAQEVQLPLLIDGAPDDGSMDFGWSAYLTLYSQEKNVSREGEPRIDLNMDDLEQLYDELGAVFDPSWVTFIIAYRQNGPYTGNSDESVPATDLELDLTQPGRVNFVQVLDLIGARVEIEGEDESVVMESPFPNDPVQMLGYLPKLMDFATVNGASTIPGRVNINQAPRLVLEAIPGMTAEMVDSILSQRDVENSEFDEELQHETWLLSRGIVTLDEMRMLLPLVTAGGDVYRAQIVGYFDEGEISARVEAIIDATIPFPRVLAWKDMGHLGRGYARETLGVDLSDSPTGLGTSSALPYAP